ncbi:MAG: MBL fold metallo-hydrolase [Theionarchaea archaeon]|nr:MBL fold metallo-hydrolase [Theionarchaea archaeon]
MIIHAIGGYEEVGKNMTAIKVGGETVIIDMGLRVDRMMIHEDTDVHSLPEHELRKIGAIPDDRVLEGTHVVGIILSHGHLDHIGAVSKMAAKYRCPIVARPFTANIVRQILQDDRKSDRNVISVESRGSLGNFQFEFINVTHSIPDSSLVALYTKDGDVLYANDYKLDPHPTVGEVTDFKKLKGIDPKVLIIESVRVREQKKTPSERIAVMMLEDLFFDTHFDFDCVVSTTFSSHISRVSTLIDLSRKVGRQPVLLGRSLCKYWNAALEEGIVTDDVMRIARRRARQKFLKDIQNNRSDYSLMVTGHQGEIDAVLSRIVDKKTPFRLSNRDCVIFSASTIPNPVNEANRYKLETKLMMQNVRMFKDMHVSGHASKEDHRELLRIVNPEYIIPSHGEFDMISSWGTLAEEEGYVVGKDLFTLKNSQRMKIP